MKRNEVLNILGNVLRLIALSIFFAGQPSAAKAELLTVYGSPSYPPYIYLNQGVPKGILPAILDAVSKMTGDTYVVSLSLPWARAVENAKSGLGGLVNFSRTKEREEFFDFSTVMVSDDLRLVVRKGREFSYKTMADLNGRILGGGIGVSYGAEVDAAIENGSLKMTRNPKLCNCLHMLLLDRVDAVPIGGGSAGLNEVLKCDPEIQANRDQFVVLPKPLTSDPLYMAFAKSMNKKDVLERFNKALAALKKTPRYTEIVDQKY